MTIRLIDWTAAVEEIAARLAARDAYIAVLGPSAIDSGFLGRLAGITFTRAWLDTGLVLVTDTPGNLDFALPELSRLVPLTAVLVAPKTAANGRAVRQLGGQDSTATQDLIVGAGEGMRIEWPTLFVDAMALVDPAAADSIVTTAAAYASNGDPTA